MTVMLDLQGTFLDAEEKELLQHPLTRGIILFTRNYENPNQLRQLIQSIRAAQKKPLLIAVDHEGGRVQRFREGFTRLPCMKTYGDEYVTASPEEAIDHAKHHGFLMAKELKAFDIDLSFAPVLDVNYGVSQVIGDRAFSNDVDIISELATAFMHGMHAANMPAVGKHFPGHGFVTPDSHLALPVDSRDLDDILTSDFIPFKNLIHQQIDGLMTAHIIYSKIDRLPASFSRRWVTEILREQFHYQGLVFSDDLTMQAAASIGSYADRARLALEAGCDMLVVCNHRKGAIEILESLTKQKINPSQQRIDQLLLEYQHESA